MEKLIKRMKNDPGVRYVAALRAKLDIHNSRVAKNAVSKSFFPFDPLFERDAALDAQEEKVFAIVRKQIRQRLEQSKLTGQQAEDLLQHCIEPYGRKNFLQLFIEETAILGVPCRYFLLNVVVSMSAFLWTQHYIIPLIIAPAVHFVCYLYYAKHRDRLRIACAVSA